MEETTVKTTDGEDHKRDESTAHKQKNSGLIAAFKFVPLLVFAVAVIIFKLDLLLAAPIATFSAICVYMILYKAKFEQAFA